MGYGCPLDWILKSRQEIDDLVLSYLRVTVANKFIITNLIPMILIRRNIKMSCFCMKRIQSYLCKFYASKP